MTEYILAKKSLNGVTRMEMDDYFADSEIENLYSWLDRIEFSRPKKNVGKDFSDGVLVAEVVHHYFPRLVQLHNYAPASAPKQKMENWYYLNRRVLKKLDLDLSDDIIRSLSYCKSKVAEKVLMMLRLQIDRALDKSAQFQKRFPNNNLSQSMDNMEFLVSPRLLPSSNGSQQGKSKVSPRRRIPHTRRESYTSNKPLIAPVMDNVPRALVEEKQQEAVAKEETIQIMNAKIRRMEHLLSLKDVRIEDLEVRLSNLQQAQLGQHTGRM
ncbi:sperm flagellar protein 1-like [Haliotis rufescens]|uniref:sperm flagellar protein 1-like n=1 Tax=Haliotis rufescens TaxID=6454 RepID=UPI001EAFFFA1|nr:sperm flagellar protein 1-like [Haliotis rufescens]